MRFVILSSLLLLSVGCGSPPPPVSDWVPVTEVPADLMAVAQKELPKVKFETARKISVYGKPAFEIRGKLPNGKVREVEVGEDGKVLEVE
jgi:hypothetical protein